MTTQHLSTARLLAASAAVIAVSLAGAAQAGAASANRCLAPYYGATCATDGPSARAVIRGKPHHQRAAHRNATARDLRRCRGPYNLPIDCGR